MNWERLCAGQKSYSFPFSISFALSSMCQQLQRGLWGGRRKRESETDRQRVSRGRDTEGYSYCLPLDGFCSLVLGTGITRSPKPLSWPYIACFKTSWQLTGGTKANSIKSVSWSSPEAAQTHMCAHTCTESSSVALWHTFGITAVVLSERGGGGGGKCLYLVLLPSLSLSWRGVWRQGECRGRIKAAGERRESVRKSGTGVQVRHVAQVAGMLGTFSEFVVFAFFHGLKCVFSNRNVFYCTKRLLEFCGCNKKKKGFLGC